MQSVSTERDTFSRIKTILPHHKGEKDREKCMHEVTLEDKVFLISAEK